MIAWDQIAVVGNPAVVFLPQPPIISGGLVWELLDNFTTPEAAPLVSPRNAEPTGIANLTQVTGEYSIAPAGQLNFPLGAAGNQGYQNSVSTARVAGKAIITRVTFSSYVGSGGMCGLWKEDQNILQTVAGGRRYGAIFGASLLLGDLNSVTFSVGSLPTQGTPYSFATILRGTGWIMAIKGGVYADWHIAFVSPSTIAANLWATWTNIATVGASTRHGIIDLPASGYTVFSTDDGLASYSDATPLQGDSGTHDANGTFYHLITALPSVGETKFAFRMQDASNYWWVGISSTGQLALYETVAGVDTNRGAAVGVIASGDYIAIIPYGTTIRVIEGAVGGAFLTQITYASATNFSTETDWSILSLANGATFSDLQIYPEYLSGDAATALDRSLVED